ncbi:Phage protein [Streptococcus acidominimus]|uniref:Phage protein n=1 Tax=Streptococcus acidominimus TaxID=1326 RepID=A0A239X186_STRAI|nr:hypothetical protein [Streptococcus acidominimus]SNV39973.1 Phage protein [Streptococcus acidominimus]
MTVDILQVASVAGALLTLAGLVKLVVQPFQNAMRKNDDTMKRLQETITTLTFELQDSQKDRQNIHRQLEKHEDRIGKVEDDVIVNTENIKTLQKGGY